MTFGRYFSKVRINRTYCENAIYILPMDIFPAFTGSRDVTVAKNCIGIIFSNNGRIVLIKLDMPPNEAGPTMRTFIFM